MHSCRSSLTLSSPPGGVRAYSSPTAGLSRVSSPMAGAVGALTPGSAGSGGGTGGAGGSKVLTRAKRMLHRQLGAGGPGGLLGDGASGTSGTSSKRSSGGQLGGRFKFEFESAICNAPPLRGLSAPQHAASYFESNEGEAVILSGRKWCKPSAQHW